MHVIYGHTPIPAKGGAAINSETLIPRVYPEKEGMTAGKYLVTRMLISALLINMKKLERVSVCSNRRVLKLRDIHVTELQSRQTVKTSDAYGMERDSWCTVMKRKMQSKLNTVFGKPITVIIITMTMPVSIPHMNVEGNMKCGGYCLCGGGMRAIFVFF